MTPENPTEGTGSLSMDNRLDSPDWWIYHGTGEVMAPDRRERLWPVPPPWRSFGGAPDLPMPQADTFETQRRLGRFSKVPTAERSVLDQVNAAITLAKPILVEGGPGSGKSSLAYSIARELDLGRVLRWSITSRTTIQSGLYGFDAFGHAHANGMREDSGIGNFVHLGPLGTAFLPHRFPRVLLIDEIDNGDFDLPTDLSFLFEEGEFAIPELVRVRSLEPEVTVHTADPGVTAPVSDGIVQCHAFPIIIVTHNGERDLPRTFLRRCVSISIPEFDVESLSDMVAAHFPDGKAAYTDVVATLLSDRLPTDTPPSVDHVLSAIHLIRAGARDGDRQESFGSLLNAIRQRFPEEL